ncbi:ThuA domain-containing protein [Tuwongella immobilis]|nr:ThuA domain-containing protein [Tuwongella immobilis]
MTTKWVGWLTVLALSVGLMGTVRADDPKPLRALLVIGGCCHDYAKQSEILKRGIEARAHVIVDIDFVKDGSTRAAFERYRKGEWYRGYDVIIHDECSADVTDPIYVGNILKPHAEGLPAVNLHCAMHSYRIKGDDWFRFCGIQSNRHGPQQPIEITLDDPKHPILEGSSNWTTINEELYNNIKVFDTAKILATGSQEKTVKGSKPAAVIWTNTYGKARVFNSTLGHSNPTVDDPRFLRIVTRGLLWACDKPMDVYLKPEPKKLP